LRASERAAAALHETIALHRRVLDDGLEATLAAADAIVGSLRQGGKVLVFGNGGSAADAQHTVTELVGRFQKERRGYAAIALTTDGCALTSIANDYGFERIFARQIEAMARPGDVALGISTSGASANVVEALATARAMQVTTIALTGRDGGAAGRTADVHINVPSEATPRIQEVHMTLLHVICDLVESTLAAERQV
jgi:phosphoheptose isomerase